MDNKHIIRFGNDTAKMRPMIEEDILISRLSLLIVMAKAYLKSYPMGEFRRKAIKENARFIFNEAFTRTTCGASHASATKNNQQTTSCEDEHHDHLFLQRAQLLAVMVNAFVEKQATGAFRKKAMAENIEQVVEYIADGFQLGNAKILKVA